MLRYDIIMKANNMNFRNDTNHNTNDIESNDDMNEIETMNWYHLPRHPSGRGLANALEDDGTTITATTSSSDTRVVGDGSNKILGTTHSSPLDTTIVNLDDTDYKEDIEEGTSGSAIFSQDDTVPKQQETSRSHIDITFVTNEEKLDKDDNRKKSKKDSNSNHLRRTSSVLFDDSAESLQQEEEYFRLREDVYSIMILTPVCSPSFVFAMYVYIVKMTLFSVLAAGINTTDNTALWTDDILIRVAQFVLIPVAVAMQEDLIHVYQQIANVRYDDDVQSISPAARHWKWLLSYGLRCSDGLFSLAVNFQVLMTTDEALSMFLNFAALQFLQSIDDVAFTMADQGFFGDKMMHVCTIAKRVRFPRLVGNNLVNSMDSILFGLTCLALFAVYVFVLIVADDRRAEIMV